MPANDTYYPRTNDGRADWWQNIRDNGAPALTTIGFPAAAVTAITNDAAWGVYAYNTARHAFDEFARAVTAYADSILHGTPDGQLPAIPEVPAFPAAPTAVVPADLEARRERWVQQAKNMPGYDAALGAALGLEAPTTTFREDVYQCVFYGVSAPNARTVSGKFRKANGRVEGINLHGRRAGTATGWQLLGRFTATPFSASVPVAGPGPEEWEFRAVAVRRDQEFGVPSDIVPQIVRP